MERGDIYWIFLDPSFGREMGGYKVRPVVVVSIADVHGKTRVATVVPGSTTPSNFPNVVSVGPDADNKLQERTFFQCHQIRSVDQGRMTGYRIGRLRNVDMDKLEAAIGFCLGFPDP